MTRFADPLLLVVALALPFLLAAADAGFYIGFATRVMIFALAATSLNLIVGHGGMVAFGHAAFFGLGAYVVAILMSHGIDSGWLGWPLAVLVTAAAALPVGLVSLRTRGVLLHHDHAGLRPDALLPRHLRCGPTAATTACRCLGARRWHPSTWPATASSISWCWPASASSW